MDRTGRPHRQIVRALMVRLATSALVMLVAAGCASDGSRADRPATGSTTSTAERAGRPTVGGGDQAAATVDRLLVVVPRADLPRYVRAEFGDGWDYDPATGCDTRERVLAEESLVRVTLGPTRCHPIAGRWRSIYDGVVVTDPADLQIDHLVPLADAWRSGAAGWSFERRRAFANDLDDPDELVAVTAHVNTSKGDRNPADWLPPDRDAWCPYVTRWVGIKVRWGLSVTPAEKSALVRVLSGC